MKRKLSQNQLGFIVLVMLVVSAFGSISAAVFFYNSIGSSVAMIVGMFIGAYLTNFVIAIIFQWYTVRSLSLSMLLSTLKYNLDHQHEWYTYWDAY